MLNALLNTAMQNYCPYYLCQAFLWVWPRLCHC